MWKNSVWKYARSISVCNRAKVIQFKIVHRLHISPNRRHAFNNTLSPLCLKCKTQIGTLTHCLWSCNQLQIYWVKIVSEMSNLCDKELVVDPLFLIHGLPDKALILSNEKRLYNLLTFAARKNILMRWISDKTPTISGWHKILMELIPLEYLTCLVNGQPGQFYNVWKPYISNLGIDLSTILWKSFPIHVPQVSIRF